MDCVGLKNNGVLKTRWWMITGGILQGLILRLMFFIVFINNLSDGMRWDEPLSRFCMTPKWGWRIAVAEAASGGWEQGFQLEGPRQAAQKDWQKPQEVQKKQMQSLASRVLKCSGTGESVTSQGTSKKAPGNPNEQVQCE